MLIVITTPNFFDGESDLINLLFHNGLRRLHLRKPDAPLEDYEGLLRRIEPQFRHNVVLHDHFHLAFKYNVLGIHLNRRNSEIPDNFSGSVSRSLHTEEELAVMKNKYNYVTLSPIFDSISKQGYNSAFEHEKLLEMKKNGIIDSRVIALGGITAHNISQLKQYGFGGAMVLGSLWEKKDDEKEFLAEFKSLSLNAPDSIR